MSIVTSVLLTMSRVENGFDPQDGPTRQLDRINAFLSEFVELPLAFLTPYMLREKHPQTITFGGGYNFFPEAEFVAFLESMSWDSPENVVLVMQPEEGETLVWRPARS